MSIDKGEYITATKRITYNVSEIRDSLQEIWGVENVSYEEIVNLVWDYVQEDFGMLNSGYIELINEKGENLNGTE